MQKGHLSIIYLYCIAFSVSKRCIVPITVLLSTRLLETNQTHLHELRAITPLKMMGDSLAPLSILLLTKIPHNQIKNF